MIIKEKGKDVKLFKCLFTLKFIRWEKLVAFSNCFQDKNYF